MKTFSIPRDADRPVFNALLFTPKQNPYVSLYVNDEKLGAFATDGATMGYDAVGESQSAGVRLHVDKEDAKNLERWLREAHFEPGSRRKAEFAVELRVTETMASFHRTDVEGVEPFGIRNEEEDDVRRQRSLKYLTLLQELRLAADMGSHGVGCFDLNAELFGRFARVKSDSPRVHFYVTPDWQPIYVERDGSFMGAIMPLKPEVSDA